MGFGDRQFAVGYHGYGVPRNQTTYYDPHMHKYIVGDGIFQDALEFGKKTLADYLKSDASKEHLAAGINLLKGEAIKHLEKKPLEASSQATAKEATEEKALPLSEKGHKVLSRLLKKGMQ